MRFNSQFNLFTYVNVCRAEVYGLWFVNKMGIPGVMLPF